MKHRDPPWVKRSFRNSVYVKTPRCASSSIVRALVDNRLALPEEFGASDERGGFPVAVARANLTGIDYCTKAPDDYLALASGVHAPRQWTEEPDLFLWTVVRNPFEKAVSAFIQNKDRGLLSPKCTFEEYLFMLWQIWFAASTHPPDIPTPRSAMENLVEWVRWSEILQNPQPQLTGPNEVPNDPGMDHIFDCFYHGANWESMILFEHPDPWLNLNLITRTIPGYGWGRPGPLGRGPEYLIPGCGWKGKPRHLDFVVKFESLQNDFDKLCDLLDYPTIQLPHENKSHTRNRPAYKKYYTETSYNMTIDLYYHEITTFGYSFGS